MKIDGPGVLYSLPTAPAADRARVREAAPVQPATTVSLSPQASWMDSLRAEAASVPAIRQDVVAEARAAVENGTLEQSVDWDAMLGSVLGDL